jgi:hypothetical protein
LSGGNGRIAKTWSQSLPTLEFDRFRKTRTFGGRNFPLTFCSRCVLLALLLTPGRRKNQGEQGVGMARFLKVLLLLIFLPVCAPAAEHPSDSFVVYSNVCVHRETGDFLGTRIALLRFADGAYVLVQVGEGELSAPEVIKLTDDPWRTQRLRFALTGSPKVFRGTLSPAALSGNFDEAGLNAVGRPVTQLPRSTDRFFPECR